MNVQDALFNWLQIKLVQEARPDDGAAKETVDFFEQILREDHKMTVFEVVRTDDTMVHIQYETDGRKKLQMFDREAAERLLADIEANPKYNE
ncbi:hypothetical protein MJA45_10860 [Paenibacillus aurantius]|uniref:Uncharacterized protein n=1 Tax=Paenibacillus aurantius TaxID=2918900 RepID=A0AA96LHQ5_9BACL|nr:hypothetical protein [Paenibacillus aurantius]WJH33063.1 hypothetical protein N6H14_23105 [Paenibacillus sp. CC-CFT747]WNQ13489.1 hypothetical protein MJA45_10860 [Paenibacillus aurantius]